MASMVLLMLMMLQPWMMILVVPMWMMLTVLMLVLLIVWLMSLTVPSVLMVDAAHVADGTDGYGDHGYVADGTVSGADTADADGSVEY